MNGWVIYNGHLKGSKFLEFAQAIQQAGSTNNINIEIVQNNHLLSLISNDGNDLLTYAKKEQPDFVIFGDKDIALARQLELLQIPVFNSSAAIEICDNKINTYQRLAEYKLPVPKTIVAPKVFTNTEKIEIDSFLTVESILNYPMVVKEAYGSFGEQVYLVHSREELLAQIEKIVDKPFVIQEFISTSFGRDIRLNVVGDKVVASMLRRADNDFRANNSSRNTTEIYEPTQHELQLAIHATKAIGADFAGVDLLFGPDGEPVICEVNSNAHIRKTVETTGINVADHIVKFVINQVS